MSTNQIPEGFMQNSQGHLVPEAQVREQDKLRDSVVNDLAAEAREISLRLMKFKRRALADISDLIQVAADKYEVDLGGKKGNVSLTSYNGKYRIQRVYSERIEFTEELHAAQALFGRCLDRWTEHADNNIRALVDRAFRTNSNGQIKTAELLGLLRLDIKDPDWQQACEALKDSITVSGTTVYIRIYERVGDSDRYRLVPLDLASVGGNHVSHTHA